MKVILVFLVILCPLFLPTKAAADFTLIHEGKTDKIIIFVHGLWGDPITSFTAEGSRTSWPELIAKDNSKMRAGPSLSEYAVGTLGYPASSSDTLSIAEVANRLVTDLIDNEVFDKYSQIFFICHSLGGIVIKEVFHILKIEHSKDSDKVIAIFLISAPSRGAQAASFIKLLPRVISGRLVLDIQTIDNNTYLQSLESKWEAILRKKNKFPLVYCAYETQPIGGITVVSQIYTATRCDETPRAENSDHIRIVKPKSINDSIYQWVRGRIGSIQREYFATHDGTDDSGNKATNNKQQDNNCIAQHSQEKLGINVTVNKCVFSKGTVVCPLFIKNIRFENARVSLLKGYSNMIYGYDGFKNSNKIKAENSSMDAIEDNRGQAVKENLRLGKIAEGNLIFRNIPEKAQVVEYLETDIVVQGSEERYIFKCIPLHRKN